MKSSNISINRNNFQQLDIRNNPNLEEKTFADC